MAVEVEVLHFFFLALTTTVVDSDWDSGRKSSHSFKLGENMRFIVISLTAAPLTFDLSIVSGGYLPVKLLINQASHSRSYVLYLQVNIYLWRVTNR